MSIHLSSVFFNLRRVDFGPSANMSIDVGFALSFFMLRVLLLPALWVRFLWHATQSEPSTWGLCYCHCRHDTHHLNIRLPSTLVLNSLSPLPLSSPPCRPVYDGRACCIPRPWRRVCDPWPQWLLGSADPRQAALKIKKKLCKKKEEEPQSICFDGRW